MNDSYVAFSAKFVSKTFEDFNLAAMKGTKVSFATSEFVAILIASAAAKATSSVLLESV